MRNGVTTDESTSGGGNNALLRSVFHQVRKSFRHIDFGMQVWRLHDVNSPSQYVDNNSGSRLDSPLCP